CQHDSGTPWTF
nr:immunoglobulin light chain junction region [Macaca mulatta]